MPIYRLSQRRDPRSYGLTNWRTRLGLDDLELRFATYLEYSEALSEDQEQRLRAGFLATSVTDATFDPDFEEGRCFEVGYHRGIVDNESPSLLRVAHVLGLPAVAAKVGLVFYSNDPSLGTRLRERVVNPSIETLHSTVPRFETLLPIARAEPAERYDLRGLDDGELAALGKADGRNLSLNGMKRIRAIQERTHDANVADVLLEALDARWSDHCAHTTWQSLGNLLKTLKHASRDTENANIISMFRDNAGVWDFYDGWGIAFKAETHNGPSAISAYFGQLTKVGGVLRDILGTGLGADPIGVFEYTATGMPDEVAPIAGRPGPRSIAHETIRAVKEYGNTFGVPMMAARMDFHSNYRAKPFALGGSIGMVPNRFAQKGEPRPGDHVVLIGGLTGNDGIHGASQSSVGGDMDNTAVQIGSPLEEVKFRGAILALRDAGCLRAVTDVGGAGLNSAVGEMGEACGVWINTALVPLKTAGLAMWRILLSESQERMVLAVPPDRLSEARRVLDRHEVPHRVVGGFTDAATYRVFHDTAMNEADAVAEPRDPNLSEQAELGFEVVYEDIEAEGEDWDLVDPPEVPYLAGQIDPSVQVNSELLAKVMAHPRIVSQKFASEQYDSSVQGRMVYGPRCLPNESVDTSFSALQPLDDHPGAALFAAAFEPQLFEVHPTLAARQLYCRLLVTLRIAGVAVRDIAMCDNFYTPDRAPNGHAWLRAMVLELAELSRQFGAPFISGKDSSAGSTVTENEVVHVPPAVYLSAIGKIQDAAHLVTDTPQRAGSALVLVGPRTPGWAGTVASELFEIDASGLDTIDTDGLGDTLDALKSLPRGLVQSFRMIGPAGTLGAAIQLSASGAVGVSLNAESAGRLLMEHRCAALLEIDPARIDELPKSLNAEVVGHLTTEPRTVTMDGETLVDPSMWGAWDVGFQEALAWA